MNGKSECILDEHFDVHALIARAIAALRLAAAWLHGRRLAAERIAAEFRLAAYSITAREHGQSTAHSQIWYNTEHAHTGPVLVSLFLVALDQRVPGAVVCPVHCLAEHAEHLLATGRVEAQLLEDRRDVLAGDELGGLHHVLRQAIATLQSLEPR